MGRQREDTTALAERKGWTVVDEYVDNDVSASTGKVRPEYQRMLRDIRAGRLDAVVVWNVDRLTRRNIEIEEFLELSDDHNVDLASVGGDVDIASYQGRFVLRMLGAAARNEVDIKADRQRRQRQQAAEAGRIVGGPRAFGYTPDGLHLDPDEAPLAREMFERFISGDTLGSIARWLNDRGAITPRGYPWRFQTVRTVLANPRYAGLRGVRRLLPGKAGRQGARETWHSIVADAVWPAIVDRETWDVVMATLRDPKRREGHVDNRQRYLLSGIAKCWSCGERLVTGRRDGDRILKCPSLRHVSRKAEPIEQWVVAVLMARLAQPEALDVLRRRNVDSGVDLSELRERAAELRGRKSQLLASYADAGLDWADVVVASKRIDAQLDEIDDQISVAGRHDRSVEIIGVDDPRQVWNAWPLATQRQVLAARLDIVVHAGRPGRPGGKRFDPDTVTVTWRD